MFDVLQLLSCFSVPTVLGLSYLFLRARYTRLHYAAVVICLTGAAFLIWADYDTGRDLLGKNIRPIFYLCPNRKIGAVKFVVLTGLSPDPLYGDLLCLAAAIVYGLSNVSQEFFVKNFSPYEFLGFVGLFGSFISAMLG